MTLSRVLYILFVVFILCRLSINSHSYYSSSFSPYSPSVILSVFWWEDGVSGKHWPGPSTCLTVTFILELWRYLEHTIQSSFATGSTTVVSCSDGTRLQASISSAVCPHSAGRIRGTAWYRRRLCPDITITSPLCMYIAIGESCLWMPPKRKMADWPKLWQRTTGYRLRSLYYVNRDKDISFQKVTLVNK